MLIFRNVMFWNDPDKLNHLTAWIFFISTVIGLFAIFKNTQYIKKEKQFDIIDNFYNKCDYVINEYQNIKTYYEAQLKQDEYKVKPPWGFIPLSNQTSFGGRLQEIREDEAEGSNKVNMYFISLRNINDEITLLKKKIRLLFEQDTVNTAVKLTDLMLNNIVLIEKYRVENGFYYEAFDENSLKQFGENLDQCQKELSTLEIIIKRLI